jgi:hypothetical protein
LPGDFPDESLGTKSGVGESRPGPGDSTFRPGDDKPILKDSCR